MQLNASEEPSDLPKTKEGAHQNSNMHQSQLPQEALCHVLQNGVKLSLFQGDITDQHVDAIISGEVDERLMGLGFVRDTILRKGGSQITDECRKIMLGREELLNEGEVVYTSGGNLPCRYVMHMVCADLKSYEEEHYVTLRQTFLESLRVASRLGLCSIAFPDLSIFIKPKMVEMCAQAMLNAVEDFSTSQDDAQLSNLRDVRIVLFLPSAMYAFREEFAKRYPSQEGPFTKMTKMERPTNKERDDSSPRSEEGEVLPDEQDHDAPNGPQQRIKVCSATRSQEV